MAENSKIEWTDHTFNPWWGCVRVSPGCPAAVAEMPPPPRRISVAEITAALEKALASIDLPVTVRVRRILVDPEYSIDDDELLTAGVAVKLGLIAREEP